MALRTYGDKPISFQFEENGEDYCIGTEVGKYLCLFRSSLYKRYPGMFRRSITNNERKKLVELGLSQHILTSSVIIVRASEVEDIIKGNDRKYNTASNHSTGRRLSRKHKYQRTMPSATKSSHLDTILPAGQINRKRLHDKKVITLSQCFNDKNPSANMKIAEQQGTSMPWRLDEEVKARKLGDISTGNNNANGAAKPVLREDCIATEIEVENTEAAENSSQLEPTHSQKCRLCLKNDDQFLELFQNDDVLPLKIMAFASVKIERGDGLPSVICVSCRQLLDISYNFKFLVEKSDTALRETLLTRVEMNRNSVEESLARSVTNDSVIQYKSQLLPLQNIHHPVSNDHNNRQDSVAREINEECISGSNHLHKKGPEDKNRDNELDNEKKAAKKGDFNESEIIPRLNRSEILLENLLEDRVSVIQSTRSMESESEPIKHKELLLPEEISWSEGEDNHHEAGTELRYTCYWCKKQFSDTAELMNHARKDHDSSKDDNRSERLERTKESWKHQNNLSNSKINESYDNNSGLVGLQCIQCGMPFVTKERLKKHILTHYDFKFECSICAKDFRYLDVLKDHLESKH